MRAQLGHRHAMLARELVQLADLRFDLGESLGIEFERALIARQRVAGFVELDLRRIEQIDDRRHARIERGQARRFRLCARDKADQREFAVAVDALGESAAALQELAGVGESAMLVFECGKVARRQRVAIELVELVRAASRCARHDRAPRESSAMRAPASRQALARRATSPRSGTSPANASSRASCCVGSSSA